jgi:hypothetical protein
MFSAGHPRDRQRRTPTRTGQGRPQTRTLDDGRTGHLLGFTIEHSVTVGTATPGFAGQEASFHPLPAARVERRRQVVFRYWTAAGEVSLTLAEARRPA